MRMSDTFQHPGWGLNDESAAAGAEVEQVSPYLTASPHHPQAQDALLAQMQSHAAAKEQEVADYRELLHSLSRRLWPRETQELYDKSPRVFHDMKAEEWDDFTTHCLASVAPVPVPAPPPPPPPVERKPARDQEGATPPRRKTRITTRTANGKVTRVGGSRKVLSRPPPQKHKPMSELDWPQMQNLVAHNNFCEDAHLKALCQKVVDACHGMPTAAEILEQRMRDGWVRQKDSIIGLEPYLIPDDGMPAQWRNNSNWTKLNRMYPNRDAHNEAALRYGVRIMDGGEEWVTLAPVDAGYTWHQEVRDTLRSVHYVFTADDLKNLPGMSLSRLFAKNIMGVPVVAVVPDEATETLLRERMRTSGLEDIPLIFVRLNEAVNADDPKASSVAKALKAVDAAHPSPGTVVPAQPTGDPFFDFDALGHNIANAFDQIPDAKLKRSMPQRIHPRDLKALSRPTEDAEPPVADEEHDI